MSVTRREFLRRAAAAGAGSVASPILGGTVLARAALTPPSPVVVASANGLRAVTRAMEMIRDGADALDAVIAGVTIVEEDPNDTSVGYRRPSQ